MAQRLVEVRLRASIAIVSLVSPPVSQTVHKRQGQSSRNTRERRKVKTYGRNIVITENE